MHDCLLQILDHISLQYAQIANEKQTNDTKNARYTNERMHDSQTNYTENANAHSIHEANARFTNERIIGA
jgi:hypothetical protein